MTLKAKQCPCGRLYVPSIGQRACHTIKASQRRSNSELCGCEHFGAACRHDGYFTTPQARCTHCGEAFDNGHAIAPPESDQNGSTSEATR